ncbi:MAG: hypothetical protein C4300_08920, partial [Thermus sp.]
MRWVWVLLLLLLGGLFWWGMQRNPRELPSVLAQERRLAPDFTLPLLPPYRAEWGEGFRLYDHLGKKPILLNFWASWCPPCQAETPVLRDVAAAYAERGLVLIGISVQETSIDDVRAYARRYELGYVVAADQAGDVFRRYRIFALPTQVFIDPVGDHFRTRMTHTLETAAISRV